MPFTVPGRPLELAARSPARPGPGQVLLRVSACAFAAIAERIRANTDTMLREAKSGGVLPREAAEALAVRRVRQTMGCRRFSIL